MKELTKNCSYKCSISLRPINHYWYTIAKFFIPFLTPVSTSSFAIKDSFSFVQELLNEDITSGNVVMACFNVASLFTIIPVDKTKLFHFIFLPIVRVLKLVHSSPNFYLLL